jgi:hypothetical protein
MDPSTVHTLLPRTKIYPSHYFKIQQKIWVVQALERTYEKTFIQIEWKFDHFFALRKQLFPIRFSRVSGHFAAYCSLLFPLHLFLHSLFINKPWPSGRGNDCFLHWEKISTCIITIVCPFNPKMERHWESEKRGTEPFLPHSILSFIDFPSFRTLFLWTMSMLSCLRLHQPGINNYPRWKFRTTSHANNKWKRMGKSTEKEGGEVTNKLFTRALVLLHHPSDLKCSNSIY